MHSWILAANLSTLEYIYDIRSWLSPFIHEIHNHTIPHVFLFKKGLDGHCEMIYKNWAKDEWILSGRLLKVRLEMLKL